MPHQIDKFDDEFTRLFNFHKGLLIEVLRERMANGPKDVEWEAEMDDLKMEMSDFFDKAICTIGAYHTEEELRLAWLGSSL